MHREIRKPARIIAHFRFSNLNTLPSHIYQSKVESISPFIFVFNESNQKRYVFAHIERFIFLHKNVSDAEYETH